MALSDQALVSLEETRVYLRINDADAADTHDLVELLINTVSLAIENKTGKKFRKATITEIVDGNDKTKMWLRYKPVASVAVTVYFYDGEEWDDVSASPYTLTVEFDSATGEVWFDQRGQTFPEGNKNIKFVYDAGYDGEANIPFNIKLAALKLIGHYYKETRDSLHGTKSQMVDGMTTAYELTEWPDDVLQLLGIKNKLCI